MMDATDGIRPRHTYHHGDLRRRCWMQASPWRAMAGPMPWCCARPRGVPAWYPTLHTGTSPAVTRCCRRCARPHSPRSRWRWRSSWRGCATADPVQACARSAPPTCGSHAPSPACSVPPSPSRARPRRPAVRRWRARAASIPSNCWASRLTGWSQAGVLPAERRPGAEYLAWSAVHGLAMLVLEGPLRRLPRTQTRVIEQRLLDMVDKGL